MARIFAAYKRKVPFIVEHVDALAEALGAKAGDLSAFQSTLGRTAIRQVETLYVAQLMKDWTVELMEALASGDSSTSASLRPSPVRYRLLGGSARALYHSETVKNGKIEGYQIIIPSTWNLAPKNAEGVNGPLEGGSDRRACSGYRYAHQRAPAPFTASILARLAPFT